MNCGAMAAKPTGRLRGPTTPPVGSAAMNEPPPAATFGPNAWLVDEMHERFLADPQAVSESWREFFADYQPQGMSLATAPAPVAVPAPPPPPPPPVAPVAPAAPACPAVPPAA